jgi:SAM-dependent methyltransferase
MTYSKERIEWWKERSLLPDHQRAYDEVAAEIPKEAQTVIDLGCGTGEIPTRLYKANPDRAIIGTDDSESSLDLLRQNLDAHGIEFRLVKPSEVKAPPRGISILVDNMLKSNIPSNSADAVTLTFPEATSEYIMNEPDKKELWSFARHLGHPIPTHAILDYLKAIKLSGLVSRILRPQGIYVLARYDVALPGTVYSSKVRRDMTKQHEFHNLRFMSTRFQASVEVHQDTDSYKPLDGEIRGYRIWTFRKHSS